MTPWILLKPENQLGRYFWFKNEVFLKRVSMFAEEGLACATMRDCLTLSCLRIGEKRW